MAIQDVEVAFRGVEVGELEALLKTASPQHKSRPYSSALEDSAVAGEISPVREDCNVDECVAVQIGIALQSILARTPTRHFC